ncbi:MAG: nitroreductase [Actinomycetota bacterium]|nr:nitroreductase [Actinomycetota bacterium]
MSATDPTTEDEVLLVAAEAASLAPSVHNSQPWGFTLHGDSLDVFADRSRWLPATDPTGRELMISCGAAICYAALALRGMGRDVRTTLLPDLSNADHLARLSLGGRRPASYSERALIRALPIRHTDRGRYEDRPVPAALIEELRRGVAGYGAWLRSVVTAEDEIETAVLLSRADAIERADPAFVGELAAWSRDDDDSLDGIPRAAVPSTPVADRASNYRLRDFDVAGRAAGGDLHRPIVVDSPPSPEHPLVVVIGTPDDDRRAWLQAGQALGWLLLRATADGVSSAPMTQVLELPATRGRLRSALQLVGHPQMLLRMGYGSGRPTTHRRPMADVISADR